MVEFNANGLYGFFQLMKNLSVAGVKFCNEWLWWLIEKTIEKIRNAKDWIKNKFRDYFLKKDLTKDELQNQISVLQKILRVVLFLVVVNIIRVLIRVYKARKA